MTRGAKRTHRPDPLQRDVPLNHVLDVPVLGIPVRFATNDREVLSVVDESFGFIRGVTSADLPAPTRLDVRITVHEGDEGPTDHAPIAARVPDRGRLLLMTPSSTGMADVARGDAVAYVTPGLVADRQHFRYAMLEALTLFLVTHFDRQPVHAAAVAREQGGLLLAGPSGVGKSSLAYAALRSGLRVLSDDAVYVQRRPRLRVWGMPRFLHLIPASSTFFPELSDALPTARATGKLKLAVDLQVPHRMVTPPVLERVGLCLLVRGQRTTRLTPISPRVATEVLRRESDTGFDLFTDALEECVAELARGGCWQLTVADPPQALVPHLDEMLRAVDAVG